MFELNLKKQYQTILNNFRIQKCEKSQIDKNREKLKEQVCLNKDASEVRDLDIIAERFVRFAGLLDLSDLSDLSISSI